MKSAKWYLSEMVPEATIVWVVSICSLGSIIAVVFGCICGCRKKTPKNDLMGLAGLVKLTNPDESVNYNTTVPAVQLNSINLSSAELAREVLEPSGRQSAGGVASATRSLPELPFETDRVPGSGDSMWETNDTSSDLYATVEENKLDGRIGGEKKLLAGLTVIGGYSGSPQTEDSLSPYARVKGDHPYDRVKQSEHPYAQVVRANGAPAGIKNLTDNSLDDSQFVATSSNFVQDGVVSPVAPPRTRKSLASSQTSIPGLDGCTIPAATAIAGGIPANQELPYMTPPLVNIASSANSSAPVPSATNASCLPNQPQHFSGDSQDSSKGYTSISVREPLSNILGDRNTHNRRQEIVDPHYATVSDDSDEMYAAIEEPNQAVYTSGSETYAQIRPSRPTLAPIDDSDTPTSSNPISSLKNEHSRQASSSSAASSGVCPSSPKPEKRQANSPLPRPPDPSTSNSSPATGVDDMYAKVMKKRRSSQSMSSADHDMEEPISLGYEPLHSSSEPLHDSLAPPPGYERLGHHNTDDSGSDPNYEELRPQELKVTASIEASYATVNKSSNLLRLVSRSEPDYASLSRTGGPASSGYDPNYESVCTGSISDPNYESLEQNDEPPYEKLQTTSEDASPDYETVYKVNSELYAKVNKHSSNREPL